MHESCQPVATALPCLVVTMGTNGALLGTGQPNPTSFYELGLFPDPWGLARNCDSLRACRKVTWMDPRQQIYDEGMRAFYLWTNPCPSCPIFTTIPDLDCLHGDRERAAPLAGGDLSHACLRRGVSDSELIGAKTDFPPSTPARASICTSHSSPSSSPSPDSKGILSTQC